MARTSLNAGLRTLTGAIDRWVYKQYKYGTVITRRPDLSGVKPTPKQLAHREDVRRAGEFHRRVVLANPALLARFTELARRKGIPVSAVSLAEYLKTVRRKRAAGAKPGPRAQPIRHPGSGPEPKLRRFMAAHRSLRKAYEKLSKRELVEILMRAEMRAAEFPVA